MPSLAKAHNIECLRRIARRRLPGPIYEYLDGGAEDEVTLQRNSRAFSEYELLPQVFVDVSSIRSSTTVFGKEVSLPLMLSPTGLTRMFHRDAEIAVARAAARHGLLYTLSTMGTTSIEDLAAATSSPKVFQIYIFRDRGLTREFLARCTDAGFDGISLTVDTPVLGNRERDRRNGLAIPPSLTPKSFLSFAMHPFWSLGALTGAKFELANVSHRIEGLTDKSMSLFDYMNGQMDPTLRWNDLEWLAAEWGGPLAVKGIMTAADAERAMSCGATGIIISNHGGRQLDGAPAPVDQIADIRAAVGPDCDVICDGGVRRGSDIVKALALGASAVSIGRPYLWALCAGGQAGVGRALSLFREEFERAMALLGVDDISSLDCRLIRRRKS